MSRIKTPPFSSLRSKQLKHLGGELHVLLCTNHFLFLSPLHEFARIVASLTVLILDRGNEGGLIQSIAKIGLSTFRDLGVAFSDSLPLRSSLRSNPQLQDLSPMLSKPFGSPIAPRPWPTLGTSGIVNRYVIFQKPLITLRVLLFRSP